MRPPSAIERQIAGAYTRLVETTGRRPYRAGSFSSLSAEAGVYAANWWQEEEHDQFFTGCPDFELRPTMVALIEAARACCDCSSREEIGRLVDHARTELDR